MRLSTPTAQTDPAPTAIRGNPSLGIVYMLGLRDNSTVSVTFRLMGSTRETLVVALTPKLSLPAPLPTQTAPPPTARSVGRGPAENRFTARVAGSSRATVSVSLSSTQTAPSPTAMLLGAVVASVKDPTPPSASSATTKLPGGRDSTSPRPRYSAAAAAVATAASAAPI